MANHVYPLTLTKIMKGDCDLDTADFRVVAVDTATYAYSATHAFLSQLSGVVSSAVAATGKAVSDIADGGMYDTADLVLTGVTGTARAIVGYDHNGGADSARKLLTFADSVSGLPLTMSGGSFSLAVNPAGWFTIANLNTATFPLSMSANSKYLVDAQGAPYLQGGDSAWLLAAQPTLSQATSYLDNRVAAGCNAIYVQLFARRSDHANDADAAGNAPFTNTATLALNSNYVNTLKNLAAACQSRGVSLCYSFYFGYGGASDDGYWDLFSAAGASNCQTMAANIASALAPYPCVWYQVGGDYMPPSATIANAIYDGIRSVSTSVLVTGYWGSESPGTTSADLAAWWSHVGSTPRVVGVSSWGDPPNLIASVYGAGAPVAFMEGAYEHNLTYFGPDDATNRAVVRGNAINAFLRGALAGLFYGNERVWTFDSSDHPAQSGAPSGHSFTEYLGDTGFVQHARICNFFRSLRWWDLIPDSASQLVTSARGSGSSYVGAAKTADGKLAVVYLPDSSSVTIDRTRMSGTITAQWFNLSTGAYTSIGSFPNTGTQSFTAIGHADGADSVLVLTCP